MKSLIPFILLCVSMSAVAEEREPTIRILTDLNTGERGLLVTIPAKLPFEGEGAGKVPIRVLNCLEEDVFVEVSGADNLPYTLMPWGGGAEVRGPTPRDPPGPVTLYRPLFSLLNRAIFTEGRPTFRGNAGVRIDGKLPDCALGGRARGTVRVTIRGYYRNTGKHFSETVELPIELVAPEDMEAQP